MKKNFSFLRVTPVISLALILFGFSRALAQEKFVGVFFNVRDYGATGDGQAIDTKPIQRAIDACAKNGGGTVVFPAGKYVTGTFELRSHTTLALEAGAVIQGSSNLADYRTKKSYGLPGESGQSGEGLRAGLIVARGAENIAIVGPGEIDGRGTSFVDVNKPHYGEPPDFDARLTRQGAEFMNPKFGTGDGPVRPRMPWNDRPGALIILADCRHVLVRDVILRDSHNWTLNFADCEDVEVRGLSVLNNLLIPNNDGINITARHARISDCYISAGDDAIAANDCENLTVTNCTLISRSSAIRFTGGRYCTFTNLVIRDSNRGIGIYGSADTVSFSDILIQTRLHTGHWWGKGEPIHISVSADRKTTDGPAIHDVHFSNITAESESGILIYGTEANAIARLSFDRVRLRIKAGANQAAVGGNFDLRGVGGGLATAIFKHDIPGLCCQHVNGLAIRGLEVEWVGALPDYFSSGISCEHFTDLSIDGFLGRQAQRTGAAIELRHGATVSIRNSEAAAGTDTFLSLDDVSDQRLFAANDLARANRATEPAQSQFRASGNAQPR